MTTIPRSHAVVLGASMGGLLAARALADHFERVTIIERDCFPRDVQQRKGVPQGRHAHGLLAGGCRVLEQLFPGFVTELCARGALRAEVGQAARYVIGSSMLAPVSSGIHSVLMSRPLLETHVRERVLALSNVRAIEDCDVLGLVGSAERITGVRIQPRSAGAERQQLAADLVIDASGRGSRMPHWLELLGLRAPDEQHVRVDVGYTSCIYRRRPEHLGGRLAQIVGTAPPNRRCGVALALEHERWIVTLVGYLGDRAPATHEGLVEFARGLPSSDLYELLRQAEPCAEPVTATFRDSQRRRYERLRRFPEGLLVFGDAICAFNPTYGQGMSVAALEAELLGQCLALGPRAIWRDFFRGAAEIIDVPWSLAVGADLGFPEVEGERPLPGRVIGAYVKRLQRAAAHDPQLALAFLRVAQMIDRPSVLFAPSVVARVFGGSLFARAARPQAAGSPQLGS